MITKNYLLNLGHGTCKRREHRRMIFFEKKCDSPVFSFLGYKVIFIVF